MTYSSYLVNQPLLLLTSNILTFTSTVGEVESAKVVTHFFNIQNVNLTSTIVNNDGSIFWCAEINEKYLIFPKCMH